MTRHVARAPMLALLLALCCALSSDAETILLANDHVRFRIDVPRGIIVAGEHAPTGQAVFDDVGGTYRLGRPAVTEEEGPFDVSVADEADDALVAGSEQRGDGHFAAQYRNPGLPDVVIEKRYDLAPGAWYIAKRVRFLPERDLEAGIEYALEVETRRDFRDGSCYHCPMGIHFGQRTPSWVRADEVGEGLSISQRGIGGAGEGMHAFVVCANPDLDLAAVTWRYRVNGRFVKPSWMALLGSGIRYHPRGWEMGVFSEYLAPDREISAEVHIGVLAGTQGAPGDHVTAHRRYQELPEWQAIVHDREVANDESPAWLDRVKLATMGLEGRSGPLAIWRNYGRYVNEGPAMILAGGVGGPVWSGDGPVGTVYVEDGSLYQKADGALIHDAAWFRDFFEGYREAVPGAHVGPYFLSPEVNIKRSRALQGYYTPLGPWEGLTVPDDIDYVRRQWQASMRAWDADFLYMDGAPDTGGAIDFERQIVYHNYDAIAFDAIDFERQIVYHNYDAIAFDRATRAAVRAISPEHIYWRNSEVNVYSDCGFAELSGAGNWREAVERVGWRNFADRLLKVKLYERPGKWQAPLYPGAGNEYANYVLTFGFRPWALPPCPLANAMYEVRNMRLVDADIEPCWWRDYGEVEAYALALGATCVLSAINHAEGEPVTAPVTADREALGLDAGRPCFVWECAPVEDIRRSPLDDHVVQGLWGDERWANGTAVRRRLVSVIDRPGERVGAEVELPHNRLRQLALSQVPAIVYAASGYRRNYPLTDFLDVHLSGQIDVGARRITVRADVGEPQAEVALVAPPGWLPEQVTVDGRPVEALAIAEEGATLVPVALTTGRHRIEGRFREAGDAGEIELADITLPPAWGAFVEGHEGLALRVGEATTASFPLEGTITPERGSIELAFRPEFAFDADETHVLLSAGSREASFAIYKLAGTDGLCFNIFAGGTDHPIVGVSARFEPGAWHTVRVTWDQPAGHEAMYYDGELVAEADRPIAPLAGWSGRMMLGRRRDGVMPADATIDDLTITDGERPLLACRFEGELLDEVRGIAGDVASSAAAGDSLAVSFDLHVDGEAPAEPGAWVLLRQGAVVAHGDLTPIGGARRELRLAIPERAEAGRYALRAGLLGADLARWPEVMRLGIIPRSESETVTAVENREVDVSWDGHRVNRVLGIASVGAIDPTCAAHVDASRGVFDLRVGTAWADASLVAGGLQIEGLERLAFEITESDEVVQPRPGLFVRMERRANSFSGLMVDFWTPGGYTRRVALATGAITRRTSRAPDWGWAVDTRGGHPLLADLTEGLRMGEPRRFAIDLAPLAPEGWEGTVQVSAVLHERLLTTTLRVRLLTAEEAADLPLTPAPIIDLAPRLSVPRLGAPVAIDGAIEDAWAGAATVEPFYALGSVRRAAEQSRAWVARDDDALLLAVECDDSDVIATARGDDAPVWRDDDIEIFVQPPGDASFYQFAANPGGGRFDTRGDDSSYAPDWQVATARTDGGWTLEARIPFAVLEREAPAPGEQWRLAICRSNQGGAAAELSCWPVYRERDFRRPKDFAPAVFE